MEPRTVVVAVVELFVALLSGEVAVTNALFVTVPRVLEPTATTIVTVAESPGAIEPRGQLTLLVLVQGPPCDAVAETNVTVEGIPPVTVTSVAAAGPKFGTVIVYVRLSPTFTGSGASVMPTAISAVALTVVVVVDELLSGFGSKAVLETDAVSVSVCAEVGAVSTIVTVADPPEASEPSAQLTVVVPEHDPCDAVAETSVPPGNASATVTPVAGSGPAFDAVIV
jgi:hypothetical protein